MNNEDTIFCLRQVKEFVEGRREDNEGEALDVAIKALKDSSWIPIKTRKLTEEEKEEYPDCEFMYDCKLPDDGEEVLVTTFAGNVTLDTFCRDDGCYFETYCEENEVIAWKPKPKPYEEGGADNEETDK